MSPAESLPDPVGAGAVPLDAYSSSSEGGPSGLTRFVARALVWAARSKAATLDERVEYGLYRAFVDAEMGDGGLGRRIAKAANGSLPDVINAVRQQLAALLIAEGA